MRIEMLLRSLLGIQQTFAVTQKLDKSYTQGEATD